jgi:hypothetical protein
MLTVQLEAFAVGDSTPAEGTDDGSRPSKDLIFSGAANTTEEPLVVVNEFDTGEGAGNHVYVIWKVDAFLSKCLL